MKTIRLNLLLAALLGSTISCADTSTEPFSAPRFNGIDDDGVLTPVTLTEPAVESYVYTYVDGGGGRLSDPVSGHEMKIMPKTVSEGTYFVMKTLAGPNVIVELTAWRKIDGQWVQITTFDDEGVKLRLSYANTGVKQPNKLRVVYLPDGDVNGIMDPLVTLIDKTTKQAQAKLSHFSIYSMAID
jgi:hypothetical protein